VAQHTGLASFLAVYKLNETRTQRGDALHVLDENQAAVLAPDEPVVLGGTVYSIRKAREAGLQSFDLLIVDEASQVKFGEFALTIPSLASERGRLVLAGDDLQLPPLINGQYPEREDGLPGLQDSVFAYLRARDDAQHPYTWQLLENWRMNTTLCQFPATTLYGSQYQPATDAVANRRLHLAPQEGDASPMPELLTWLLEPNYPLVVAILDGVQAATENRLEAEIVAYVTCALRLRLYQENGRRYPDSHMGDSQFWRQGLGIVSPHHVQIRAIQQALHRLRPWESTPFVDTVDKMQGQQSQAVIVSYGVSDTETALQEAEFIYRLNRLNVAITRAQAKCMVFLPRPLLEPSLELLRHDKAATGLGFMHALIDYCAQGEERAFSLTPFQHGAGARLRVLRVG
jgi:superfamily I DNA and/or RNA helicase